MGGKIIAISSGDSRKKQRLENRPPPRETENGISSLAHEINNPLEALHQLHYLIETEGTLKEKGRKYLALAREEVQRISQILHAAMELRDSGDPEDTDIPELLRSVLKFYKSRFDSQAISVNTRYRGGAHLSGYPHQLRQMCANLLLNAADAMPSGGKIYARIAPAHEWKAITSKDCVSPSQILEAALPQKISPASGTLSSPQKALRATALVFHWSRTPCKNTVGCSASAAAPEQVIAGRFSVFFCHALEPLQIQLTEAQSPSVTAANQSAR